MKDTLMTASRHAAKRAFGFSVRQSLLLSLAAVAVATVPAGAAKAIEIPASASAGQVAKQFEQTPSIPVTPDIQLVIPTEAELPQEAQDELAKHQFTLKQVEIEGSTVYSAEQLSSLYTDSVGKTLSLLDARRIAKAISAKYKNDGYVLSQAVVPPQDVTDGVLRLKVVEGFVGEVSVDSSSISKSEQAKIQAFGEKIKSHKPARIEDLERYLLLINDLPGVKATGLLRPLATQFGAAELVVSVKDKPFEGSYTLDNRGSKYIGPWQHTLTVAANSAFGRYDRTQARLFLANPTEDNMIGGEISHEQPLDSEGTKLSLLASYIHTHPGDSMEVLDVVGRSMLLQAKVVRPFLRLRKENLLGRIQFDYRDSRTEVFNDVHFTQDRLRVARAGGTYSILDAWRGNNVVDAQLSQGMNIFGATANGDDRSNAFGDSSFTKFNMEVSHLQPLPYNTSLLVAGSGQYSFDPLLSDEQFGIGGSEYGRAFDASNSIGDHGVVGKAELRYNGTVGQPYFDYYQLYTFYDMGRTWVREASAGENNKRVRSSTGAGVRMTLTENFSANFEAAVPLIKTSDDATDYRHNPRFFMSLTARF